MSEANVYEPVRRIVIGTDFSSGASTAINAASDLARRHGASMTLVHAVCAPPLPNMSLGLRELVERRLDEQAEGAHRHGIEVEAVFRAGRPWEAIDDVARERGADLIVVGARGHTVYERLLLGSTSDRIVRTSSIPVLTVRPNGDRGANGLTTVLVPVDFSDACHVSTRTALRLLGDVRARIVLLHAWQPFVEYAEDAVGGVEVGGDNERDDIVEQADQLLEQVAASVRSDTVQVDTVIRQGYPVRVIECEARAIGADLIALGTHGRTGLSHMLLGSVSERVLRHATCAVLTVRRGGQ